LSGVPEIKHLASLASDEETAHKAALAEVKTGRWAWVGIAEVATRTGELVCVHQWSHL